MSPQPLSPQPTSPQPSALSPASETIGPAAEYQRRLAGHHLGAEAICRKLGVVFQRVITSQPLELALLEFLRSRSRRNKRQHRRGP